MSLNIRDLINKDKTVKQEFEILTLFSMGYFKNTTVWGHHGPPSNFIVSGSIIIKFGVLIEFDKFSPRPQKNLK